LTDRLIGCRVLFKFALFFEQAGFHAEWLRDEP
jgi:hypothetical protein